MNNPHRIRLIAALLLIGGGTVVAGQQSAGPVFRSRVDAIEIELRVADRDGHAVNDLDQSEVEVLENGRRQEILAFSRVSVPVPTDTSAIHQPASFPPPDVATNRTAASSRIVVLILDDLHVDRRNTLQVKQAARRFVEHFMQPGDLASVVYTGIRPDAAQDFTSNRQLLIAAIDKFVGRKLPPATIERMEQYNMLFRARGRPLFEDLRDPQDGERAFNARSAMASIQAVSTALARVTGRRKAAIFFSEGLDYDLSGLRSQGRSAGALGPTVLPSTIPTGGSEADALGRLEVHSYAHDVLLSLQEAIGAAARANVVLYPMEVRAGSVTDAVADLGAPVEDPALGLTAQHVNHEMRDAQETLSVLAANTGGTVTLGPADYDVAFARVLRESSEYYLLAYSPWNPAPDGTYREVMVNVKRPDVRVSARRGYYAPRQPIKRTVRFVGKGITDETSTLVMAPIPTAGLTVDLHAVAFKHDANIADVVVTASVEGRELVDPASASGVNNTLELALMAIDSTGKVRSATARAIDVKLDAAATRVLREAGYRVVSRVQLPPGRYQIRQGIRERSGGRRGSVFTDLDVPDFSHRLSMSGILMTSNRALVPTAVDPDTYKGLAILPSVRRTFSSEDELIVANEIYDRSGDHDLQVITAVVDEAGEERYRRASKVPSSQLRGDGGTYRHTVQIPLRDMRGKLVLTVEASSIGAPSQTVAQRVGFTVSPGPSGPLR